MSGSGPSLPASDPSNLAAIFRAFEDVGAVTSLPEGHLLWRRGDAGKHVFLLLRGTMEVSRDAPTGEAGGVFLRTVREGEMVGDLAAVCGCSRTAAVRTESPCMVRRIPARVFREVVYRRPELLLPILLLQAQRLISSSDHVVEASEHCLHDPCTRVYNSQFFQECLRLQVDNADRTRDALSVAWVEVDRPHAGSQVGESPDSGPILAKVARYLSAAGRPSPRVVSRAPGWNFAILLFGAGAPEAAEYAERVRRRVERMKPGRSAGPRGSVTISVGVATYPEDGRNGLGLVLAAKRRAREARRTGGNRVIADRTLPT
ncbi:MAG: diguanylate cyclase [Planctomycetes bacterium]|nr:diguanylate cyclase [Planctomycetota bacterium]